MFQKVAISPRLFCLFLPEFICFLYLCFVYTVHSLFTSCMSALLIPAGVCLISFYQFIWAWNLSVSFTFALPVPVLGMFTIYTLIFFYYVKAIILFFKLWQCNSSLKIFILGKKIINLHKNISAIANYSAMSSIILFATTFFFLVYMLLILAVFIKHNNLILKILSIKTGSHMTMDSAYTIWIYDQFFPFWGGA